MAILIREEARSRSAIVLRVALSSTLPLILVLFAASQQGGIAEPSALYVIYNTGGYLEQPVQYAQPMQYVQPVQYAQPNAYYNAVNTAELSTNVNTYDAAALQYSSGPPQKQMQTLHALASAKQLYHQMQVPSAASPRSQYNSAVRALPPSASILFYFARFFWRAIPTRVALYVLQQRSCKW